MKVYMIDQCLDKVGGVERVCYTIWSKLHDKYNFKLISITKNNDSPFFDYDNNTIEFLYDNTKSNINIFKRIIRYLIINKKIKKSVKNMENEDIIIFGRVQIALQFLPYINKLHKKPRIIVRDAIHIEYFNEKTKKLILKYFPNNVDTFIVSSNESIKKYEEFFNTSSINITKIYNPLGIKPIHKYTYSNKTIVSIGRMDDNQKGFDNLIKAMTQVHNQYPDWKLTLYGDGKCKEQYMALIDSLSASNYIFIYPSTKNIVKVLNSSSIFVMASRYEGYANALVEAMSCGVPSISYDWLMGVDEIIDNNHNGIIVKLENRFNHYNGESNDNDCCNLSNAMCSLIEDKEKCNTYSQESIKINNSRDINKIVNEWIRLIENR